jgi:hypothetical protein
MVLRAQQGVSALERDLCVRSIVRRPGLLDDARAVAQGDLGAGPAFDRGREGRHPTLPSPADRPLSGSLTYAKDRQGENRCYIILPPW